MKCKDLFLGIVVASHFQYGDMAVDFPRPQVFDVPGFQPFEPIGLVSDGNK
jgi:hypothetical protein